MAKQFRSTCLLLVFLTTPLFFPTGNAAVPPDSTGILGDFEKEIQEGREKENEDSDEEDSDSGDESQEVTIGEYLVSEMTSSISEEILEGLFGKFLPLLFFGGDFYGHSPPLWNMAFSVYPYRYEDGIFTRESTGKNQSLHLHAYHFFHNPDLTAFGLRMVLHPVPFASLEYHATYFSEELIRGEDHLDLKSYFVNFNRIRNEKAIFYWGLGFTKIAREDIYHGLGYNVGAELFLHKPLSYQFSYNCSTVNQISVDEFQANINLHIERYYFDIGFHSFRAGDVKIQGLETGFGVYF